MLQNWLEKFVCYNNVLNCQTYEFICLQFIWNNSKNIKIDANNNNNNKRINKTIFCPFVVYILKKINNISFIFCFKKQIFCFVYSIYDYIENWNKKHREKAKWTYCYPTCVVDKAKEYVFLKTYTVKDSSTYTYSGQIRIHYSLVFYIFYTLIDK